MKPKYRVALVTGAAHGIGRAITLEAELSQPLFHFRNIGRHRQQVQVAAMPGLESTIKPLRQNQSLEPKNLNPAAI